VYDIHVDILMNQKQQTTLNEILDELLDASNNARLILEAILEYDHKEVPPELIEARDYCDNKVDKLRQELFDLINKPSSNIKKFIVGLGWFWAILLSVLAAVTGNILMVGVAAIFPFLIYPADE